MADRLAWTDGQLHVGEVSITTQAGVSIYDGSEKVRRDFFRRMKTTNFPFYFQTAYQKGLITLTSHRILWQDNTAHVIFDNNTDSESLLFCLDRIATFNCCIQ